jgi:hypothetical protein
VPVNNVPAVYKRLGKDLVVRRIQLGYDKRKQLLDVPGSPSYTVLTDFELGNRANYSPAEVARMERLLRLKYGTIDRYVAGEIAALEVLEDDDLGPFRVEMERRGITPRSLREAARIMSDMSDILDADERGADFQAVG